MMQVKCTKIIKDTKGNVIALVITDTNGNEQRVTEKALENAVRNGKISVVNLKLKRDIQKERLNKLKKEKEKMKVYLRNAIALGCNVQEIKTKRNHLCYLISVSDTEHTLYIPDDVYNCYNLVSQSHIKGNLKVIGGSHVKEFLFMFSNCSNIVSLDLSLFDASKVTDMSFMLSNCSSLKSLNLSSFNTYKATDMRYMFAGCSNLESLDLSSFDTSKVTNMMNMFDNCTSLKYLDLSNFDTSSVINMRDMFHNCNAKIKTKDAMIIKEYPNLCIIN